MAKDMTLWWGSGSPPCWRVLIALEEKNLQGYNQKLLSFEKGEHKSKEVMDVNPRGQVGLHHIHTFKLHSNPHLLKYFIFTVQLQIIMPNFEVYINNIHSTLS